MAVQRGGELGGVGGRERERERGEGRTLVLVAVHDRVVGVVLGGVAALARVKGLLLLDGFGAVLGGLAGAGLLWAGHGWRVRGLAGSPEWLEMPGEREAG